jgi:hypothetical protein
MDEVTGPAIYNNITYVNAGAGMAGIAQLVDTVALGQVFSESFGFPANIHSSNFSTITTIYHPGLVQ